MQTLPAEERPNFIEFTPTCKQGAYLFLVFDSSAIKWKYSEVMKNKILLTLQ